MKIFDFIEIGTSNFDTLLQSSQEEYGISIEPISYYLDCLPDRKNVIKVNCAVTNNRDKDKITIFYIPENVIKKNNLPLWFRGCNRIGEFHPLHIKYKVQDLVIKEEVLIKNYEEIIEEFNVYKAKKIKIDTEGHDCVIMESIFTFLNNNNRDRYPEIIIFETNTNSNPKHVMQIVEKFKKIGFFVSSRGHDITLRLK